MKACILRGPLDLTIKQTVQNQLGPQEVEVKMASAGICGSDIYYYRTGACGDFKIVEDFVPGHEASAYIFKTGAEVTHLKTGQLVAINPSDACGKCEFCLSDRANLCTDNLFAGSASRIPHTRGMMQEHFIVHQRQCVEITTDVKPGILAFAEPLSVALHAINRAGGVDGKTVLITGGRTIGLLTAIAAKALGAKRVVVSDPSDFARETAHKVGVDVVINSLNAADHEKYFSDETQFDVAFEASGSSYAFDNCLQALHRRGSLIQIGTLISAEGPKLCNLIMVKEIQVIGAFRFDKEFTQSVQMLETGMVDVAPLLTKQFPISQAADAFKLALDVNSSTKVQITCDD
ncbi:MAG: L-idonate 5-dehydrogenase [Rhizobiales bacterium]|nr:L-idonate 5-dehydrogenase [Hyphomicrobiales bacterium]NRB13649.1 L-idonate 5-dehydrogenase [Hyphomicrobiales bacterium]